MYSLSLPFLPAGWDASTVAGTPAATSGHEGRLCADCGPARDRRSLSSWQPCLPASGQPLRDKKEASSLLNRWYFGVWVPHIHTQPGAPQHIKYWAQCPACQWRPTEEQIQILSCKWVRWKGARACKPGSGADAEKTPHSSTPALGQLLVVGPWSLKASTLTRWHVSTHMLF